MEATISKPRDHVSKYAPKMEMIQLPVDKIRDVIGTGGKTINQIIEDCNQVKIDIDDDGRCIIYHTEQESIDKAKAMIENLIREAKVGEVYDATVAEVRDSFAFVNLFQGTDALLHVSEISWTRTEDIHTALHAYEQFASQVSKALVIYGEDQEARKMHMETRHYWYGLKDNDDIQAVNVQENSTGMFRVS